MTANHRSTAHRPHVISAAVLALVAATSLIATPSAAAAERNPVIFVHGLTGADWHWDEMIGDFRRDGYRADELYAWNYDYTRSNKVTAQHLAAYVDDVLARTGAGKVDLVGHSNGGMNTRWYLKFIGGTAKVDDYVSLASPQHGIDSAYSCGWTTCHELRPGSEFLTTLNAGDETPGAVHYGTWRSPCDAGIQPPETAMLKGATNTETACIGHLAFLSDDTVSAQVRAFVA